MSEQQDPRRHGNPRHYDDRTGGVFVMKDGKRVRSSDAKQTTPKVLPGVEIDDRPGANSVSPPASLAPGRIPKAPPVEDEDY